MLDIALGIFFGLGAFYLGTKKEKLDKPEIKVLESIDEDTRVISVFDGKKTTYLLQNKNR